MNLSVKTAMSIGAGTLAIVFVMATLSVRTNLAILEEDLQRDARLVATSVAIAAADLSEPEINALVSNMDGQSEDIRVRYIRADTTVEADPGAIRSLAPVGDGSIEVVESLAIRDRMLESALNSLLLTSVLVVLVSLALGHWVARMAVGRRIDSLVQKAQRVGQGRFDVPVDVRGDDELTVLATELNRMAGQLEAAWARSTEEADLRLEAEVRLRHADRLRTVGQLAAGMAHELGTPLNVISGRATLLTRALSGSKEASHADVIREQSERIAGVVRRLMDFSRARPAERAAVDLAALVRDTLDMLRPTCAESGAAVELGELAESNVDADPDQLRQVITNLVMNAVQAAPTGTVRVSVLPGPPVTLSVEDDGPGIPEHERERALEPFFTTKDPGAGTGLGLSIVHTIVREHGGTVRVDGSSLGGAKLVVELPVEDTCQA